MQASAASSVPKSPVQETVRKAPQLAPSSADWLAAHMVIRGQIILATLMLGNLILGLPVVTWLDPQSVQASAASSDLTLPPLAYAKKAQP